MVEDGRLLENKFHPMSPAFYAPSAHKSFSGWNSSFFTNFTKFLSKCHTFKEHLSFKCHVLCLLIHKTCRRFSLAKIILQNKLFFDNVGIKFSVMNFDMLKVVFKRIFKLFFLNLVLFTRKFCFFIKYSICLFFKI